MDFKHLKSGGVQGTEKKPALTRWFTCTPVDFSGGTDFFARDSGLLCRGFQSLGIESRAVMPGIKRADDETDLIRSEYHDLTSSKWWMQHDLDGVVLYAWGRPRFLPIARAIHNAGIRLVLNQDTVGIISPMNGLSDWFAERNAHLGPCLPGLPRMKRTFRITLEALYELTVVDPMRLIHLMQGDVVACVSPIATERFRKYCRIASLFGLPDRVQMIPHPVNSIFHYDGRTTKTRRITAVGRWDDHCQKRPDLMMLVAEKLVTNDESVDFDIVGKITDQLSSWHQGLRRDLACRIHLSGRLKPEQLALKLNESQIIYCSSAHESFHIASGEGLCSGCSIVSTKAPSLASFEWFASQDSGSLATNLTVEKHVYALQLELKNWQEGSRDPNTISRQWIKYLHTQNVALRILGLFV